MRIDVLTTFPELFTPAPPGVLGVSMPGRAIRDGKLRVVATNIRDFAHNRHQKTDDRPFGGGPGMVMACQPIWDAVQHIEAAASPKPRRILMTPQGVPLTQQLVEELAREPRLLILAGHYEGIDERVITKLAPLEVSIGDYVLSGGELGALVLIDAMARLLPGVLGHEDSAANDSFSVDTLDPRGRRLLDHPHYTKPRTWMDMDVPPELLSGDHAKIAAWRHEQRLERTRQRRPDIVPPQ